MEKAKALYWRKSLRIPECLIQEVSDSGLEEIHDMTGELIDSYDLRVSIVVSSGLAILLPTRSRIVIQENGDICVEVLQEYEVV